MNKVYLVCGVLASLGLAFFLGRITAPTKVETITEIQWKERIVEVERESTKTAESQKEDKDKMYIRIVREMSDGTKETETKVIDKGTIEIGKIEESEREKVVEKEVTTIERQVTTVEKQKPGWHLNFTATTQFPDIDKFDFKREGVTIGVGVQKRILGDVYVGLYGTSNKDIGLSIGVSL